MEIWTQDDETALQALVARKKRTHDVHTDAVAGAIRQHLPVAPSEVYGIRDALIANGGAFRDALMPFDENGRPKAVNPFEDRPFP